MGVPPLEFVSSLGGALFLLVREPTFEPGLLDLPLPGLFSPDAFSFFMYCA